MTTAPDLIDDTEDADRWQVFADVELETLAEKAARAEETERPSRPLVDRFVDFGCDELRELADNLTTMAEAIDDCRDVGEEWAEAEDREEKADARERFLDSIARFTDAHGTVWFRGQLGGAR